MTRKLARAVAAVLGVALCVLWLLCLGLAVARFVTAPVTRWTSRRWSWCARPWLRWSPWWLWRKLAPGTAVVRTIDRQRVRMSADERARVVAYLRGRDGDHCGSCGHPIDFWCDQSSPWAEEVDHVVPFSLGGACDVSNFRLLHARCNRRRGNRIDDLYQPGRAA